jgi:hypothetical protein
MAVLTSCTASVYWNNQKIAKLRNITPSISRNELDTTSIGECVAESIYGLRKDTLSAEIIYDPSSASTVGIMNRIFSDAHEPTDSLKIVMKNGSVQGEFTGTPVITSLSIPIQVGELMVAQISMTISGGLVGVF